MKYNKFLLYLNFNYIKIQYQQLAYMELKLCGSRSASRHDLVKLSPFTM